MRGLTAVIIAGVAIIIVAVMVFVRTEAPREPGSAVPRAEKAVPFADQGVERPRNARVGDRLDQLRSVYEQRQLGGAKLQPPKRELPPRAPGGRAMEPVEPLVREGGELEAFDEDEAEELEELRETLLNDPDPDERMGAVLMLTGSEDAEALRVLVDAMNDPDAEVRLAVVEALGDYAEDLNPEVLLPALDDPDAEVRFEAVGILGDMEQAQALALVREALDDPDEDVRALAEGILDFEDEDQR